MAILSQKIKILDGIKKAVKQKADIEIDLDELEKKLNGIYDDFSKTANLSSY